MLLPNSCETCGHPVKNATYRFCSKQCANVRTRLPDEMRACLNCGNDFLLTLPGKKRERQRYCSRKCAGKHTSQWKDGRILTTFWEEVAHCEHEWLCPYCCWPWKRETVTPYATVSLNNQGIGVHRLAWELGNGRPFPEGLHAAHYCHNTICCNFIHIHAATQKENIADSLRDHRVLFGERHGNSKLTEATAKEALYLRTEAWSIKEIALHLHVSKTTIQVFFAGGTWKHLERPPGMQSHKPWGRKKHSAMQPQLSLTRIPDSL